MSYPQPAPIFKRPGKSFRVKSIMVFYWYGKARVGQPIQNWPPMRTWARAIGWAGFTGLIGYAIYAVNMVFAEKNIQEVRSR